ncbi:bifunctional Ubiquitin-activating enzyme/THIF-type NAD-FAD binding fold/ThiF-MoeB-HesA family [Babesia duncani]|uniref:Ubiquitin-like modifier-activating enzyme 5 n=1 Tax=Babesia duncani TaxID=323732 RepID=A0AAD9PKT9_9APIC|nr:bifunctional Ubiquitin-activating enzyme/THIF-type NAD-FAD binding fold/ThiF-MoeB-HesA family [Babesia duncani]
MSELKDDPTSRLMALEKMGVVKDYSKIYSATVIIVGVGGVGAVAAEMLTRCGIGKLILFDYDTVEFANMNRLFFTPDQVGLSKVEAAQQTLNRINPNVIVEVVNCNICTDYEIFQEKIKTGGMNKSGVDLVLSCVDNYTARVTINKLCCQLNQAWMNSGVSENAISGQIQTCIPGVTACFLCIPPYVVATGGDEKSIKRPGVCTASLPTTMSIIAGLLAHNCLKYLLEFGKVSTMLTYNSLQDYLPKYTLGCSNECTEPHCLKKQEENLHMQHRIVKPEPQESAETEITHTENEFGIEIVNEPLNEPLTKIKTQEQDPNETQIESSPPEASKKTLNQLRQHFKQLSKT